MGRAEEGLTNFIYGFIVEKARCLALFLRECLWSKNNSYIPSVIPLCPALLGVIYLEGLFKASQQLSYYYYLHLHAERGQREVK